MMALKPAIKIKEQATICTLKLIVQPLLTLPLLIYFQVSAFWAACGFILSALPPATIIYILAQNYQLHERNISGVLLISNLLSIITIFIVMALVPSFWPHLHYLINP